MNLEVSILNENSMLQDLLQFCNYQCLDFSKNSIPNLQKSSTKSTQNPFCIPQPDPWIPFVNARKAPAPGFSIPAFGCLLADNLTGILTIIKFRCWNSGIRL